MIRSLKAIGAALALGSMAAACATGGAQVQPVNYDPLRLAFTAPVEALEANAEAGDEASLYALSFLAMHGLRGVPEDRPRAEALRGRLGPVTTMTAITQYIPGINGAPGSVHVMNVPVTRPNAIPVQRLDECGLPLITGLSLLAESFCGAEAHAQLAPLARPFVREVRTALYAAVDPEAATDCAGTPRLWAAAGPALQSGDVARAEILTDRIIALCGEDQRSWHPRVMRALIATEAGDPALALDLLGPVPRPAPAPIGGYVSFVAMQAHAAAGDWTSYARERDALGAASVAALDTEPAARGTRRLAEFTVGEATVHAFERETPFGRGLTALMALLVQTPGEQDGLRTYYLTTSPDMLGGDLPRYFLDEYRCDGRSTLMYFDPAPTPPSFETVRALVEQRLAGNLVETSGSSFNRGLSACQFPAQVAPGLGDDRSAPARDSASSTAEP